MEIMYLKIPFGRHATIQLPRVRVSYKAEFLYKIACIGTVDPCV